MVFKSLPLFSIPEQNKEEIISLTTFEEIKIPGWIYKEMSNCKYLAWSDGNAVTLDLLEEHIHYFYTIGEFTYRPEKITSVVLPNYKSFWSLEIL